MNLDLNLSPATLCISETLSKFLAVSVMLYFPVKKGQDRYFYFLLKVQEKKSNNM